MNVSYHSCNRATLVLHGPDGDLAIELTDVEYERRLFPAPQITAHGTDAGKERVRTPPALPEEDVEAARKELSAVLASLPYPGVRPITEVMGYLRRALWLLGLSPEERAFVREASASPQDALPVMVFADWLDDHDRPKEAERLRRAWRVRMRDVIEKMYDRHQAYVVIGRDGHAPGVRKGLRIAYDLLKKAGFVDDAVAVGYEPGDDSPADGASEWPAV